ncbi:MAG: heavy metal transporter [Flavobacteriaceae bacterium]|nr:heavy metal transporter [Flavobacteriaceae bacterium]|tara:strand:+ start:204510 stop:205217 length:708 start_codon:yes stop_codon:yes gene_type:complete
MKYYYKISGMTCIGCKTFVENQLNDLDQIKDAKVDLENQEAEINVKNNIELEVLQKKITSKYNISKKEYNSTVEVEAKKTKLQELKPLLIIFLYIIIAIIFLHYQNWRWDQVMLDFMGLFYIIFSFFKILDLKGFPESFKIYDPIAKVFPIYGWIYPFIEIILGIMFLMRFEVKIALISTILILGGTTIGVTKTLLERKKIQCACLGTHLKLPMTEATLIENVIMILMAAIMLVK